MTVVAIAGFVVQADADKVRACGPPGDERWLCDLVYDLTESYDAARLAHRLSPWVSALLILLAALLCVKLVAVVSRRVVTRLERDERSRLAPTERRIQRAVTIGAGVRSLLTIVIWVIAIIALLAAFGVSLGAVLASAGLLGVALGFGAQNVTRDLLAGTFMIFEDQLGVGDVVDLGVASGTVEQVSLRTTRLRDVEGVVWHVPNGEIRRVGNKSQQWSRAVLDVAVGYEADIDRAREVIKQTADAMAEEERWAARILDAPEVWGVESIGDDRIMIRLVVKTVPAEQWRVARELRARLKTALAAAGIPVPAAAAPPAFS